MSEPKHWLDEAGEADEFERSVLRAGLIADPPQATQDQVWSNLVGTLALAPSLAVTTGSEASAKAAASAGKASAVWFAVAKGFVVGLAVYGAAAATSEISKRRTTRPAPALSASRLTSPARPSTSSSGSEQPTAAAMPVPAPATEDAKLTPHAAVRDSGSAASPPHVSRETAGSVSSSAAFDDAEQTSRTRVSQLDGETRALRRARDELRSGKLADAFATLEASRRQFSAPELYQEREALMIELLHRSGQQMTAMQRARVFLSQFPESPHAQNVRRFAGQ